MVSISCCSVFRRSARAGLLALEQGLHTSSNLCSCKTSADVIFTLERVCLRSSGLRSSGLVGARAGSTFWVSVLGGENLRSSGLVFALERKCFIPVSWRSSGPYCARSCPNFCSWRSSVVFSARAGHTYMSYLLGDFKSLFTFLSLILFLKTIFESPSI